MNKLLLKIILNNDEEELISKRLSDAVYEFLGTKEETEITKDLLKTQLAIYRLRN